jgi:hypothetical protein
MFGSESADCFIVSHNPRNWKIVIAEPEVDQGYFVCTKVIECLGALQKGDTAVTLPIVKYTLVVGEALWAIQLPTVFTRNLRDTTVNAVVIPFKQQQDVFAP